MALFFIIISEEKQCRGEGGQRDPAVRPLLVSFPQANQPRRGSIPVSSSQASLRTKSLCTALPWDRNLGLLQVDVLGGRAFWGVWRRDRGGCIGDYPVLWEPCRVD